jgi:hypothetical protein
MGSIRRSPRCRLSLHITLTMRRSSTAARTTPQALCQPEPQHNHPPFNVIDLYSNVQRKSWQTRTTLADPAEILAWDPAEGP